MPGYQPSYELVCLLVSQHICEPEYLWELSAYLWASIPVSPSAFLWACLSTCEPAYLWVRLPTCEPVCLPVSQHSCEPVGLPVSQHTCEPEYLWASILVSQHSCEPVGLPVSRHTCEPAYLWASIPVSQQTCEPSAYLLVIWFPTDEELIFMHDFFLSSAILTLFIVLSSYSTTLTSLLTKVTQLTNAWPQMTSLGTNEVRTYSSTSTY